MLLKRCIINVQASDYGTINYNQVRDLTEENNQLQLDTVKQEMFKK